MCIQPIVCDQDAPWENGVCERRGDLFKKVYYKSRELAQPRDLDEVELLIFESAWALQTTINRSGFTPAQRVLGRQPRVALDLTSDDRHYELAVTQDKAWTRASELRDAARRALMELDAKERLQRANRGRPRRKLETRVFTEGQPVVVWRQGRRGALAKVGPCFVILQRGSTVWVTRRGELWKCDASQVFEMGPLEVQGIEVIPKDLLMAKERLRFDSEKLGFVDVSQENQPDKEERYEEEDPAEPTKLRTAAQHGLPREDGEDADLPSDAEGYSPDEIPKRPEQAQTEGPVVTTRPATKLSPPLTTTRTRSRTPEPPRQTRERPPVLPGLPEPRGGHEPASSSTAPAPAALRAQASSTEPIGPGSQQQPRPSRAPEVLPPQAREDERGQWRPTPMLKQWARYDHQATRFRVSSSQGPMWNDVVRRRTINSPTPARSLRMKSSPGMSDHDTCHDPCQLDP